MAARSVYLPEPSIENEHIRITGDEHRHLVVARTEPNETIEIFDGNGTSWTATVVSAGKRETTVRVLEMRRVPRSPVELVLGMALIRMAAFELALEKVTELGVTRIVPFTAERSNVAPGDRRERWMRIIIEAAKQSKQYYLPELDRAARFEDVLSIGAPSKIMFAEHDGASLKSALAGSPVVALIGPEGGWTKPELAAGRQNGFHAVSLGTAILKAETAAIVGVSLIRYELGG